MSLKTLTSIHTVDVLRPTAVQSASMATNRDYSRVLKTIACRVTPLTLIERVELMRLGYEVSHRIYFPADPQLHQDDRLRFQGIILRVVPPYAPDSLGRYWEGLALAHSDDNLTLDELV